MTLLKKIIPVILFLMIGKGYAQQKELVDELQNVGFEASTAVAMGKQIMDFERAFEQSGILTIIREPDLYFTVYQSHQANQMLDQYNPIKRMIEKSGIDEKKILAKKILHFMRVHGYVQKTLARMKETETHRINKLSKKIDKYVVNFPDQTDFWKSYKEAVNESVKLSSREYHETKDDQAFVEKARILVTKYNADKKNIDTMLGNIKDGNNGVAIKFQLIGWKNDQRIKSGLR